MNRLGEGGNYVCCLVIVAIFIELGGGERWGGWKVLIRDLIPSYSIKITYLFQPLLSARGNISNSRVMFYNETPCLLRRECFNKDLSVVTPVSY